MQMQRKFIRPLALGAVAVLSITLHPTSVRAQGTTAFSYQGQLSSGAGNANGLYDLRFAVYDANIAGNFIAGPITNSAVAVSNGLFTVTLDFGPARTTGWKWACAPMAAGVLPR